MSGHSEASLPTAPLPDWIKDGTDGETTVRIPMKRLSHRTSRSIFWAINHLKF